MSRDKDPLTPEERALADALADAAPRRGPSPQVDAAILASARNATARAHAPLAGRPRRRWPAMLGVAASLVVAVGIAWQLRPLPEQALPAGDGAPRPSPPPVDAVRAPAPLRQETAPHPTPGPPQSGIEDDAAAAPPSQPALPGSPAPSPPAPGAQATGAEEPAAATAQSAPSPPLAETAIGRGRVRQQAEAPPVLARTLGKSTTVTAPPDTPPPAAAGDDGGIVFDRQALHDVPPATVDSPGIHRAWLDRIRELREAGELEAARESLREYRRRYPDQPLPDDLDGLLDE